MKLSVRRSVYVLSALAAASCSAAPGESVMSSTESALAKGTTPTGRIYVANQSSGSVSVIDVATKKVLATVPTGFDTNSLAANPTDSRVYVSVPCSLDQVLTLDTVTLRPTTNINAPNWINGVAFSPDGHLAYVTAFHGNALQVIDADTEETVGQAVTGDTPTGVAVSPDGSRVYVADQGADSLSVISTSSLSSVATIPVGHWPRGVVASHDGKVVYVSNTDVGSGGTTVSVINAKTLTVVATLATGGTVPNGMTLTQDGRWLYTANAMSNNVSVIDTRAGAEVALIPVGNYPWEIALDSTEQELFVTNHNDNSVSVVSTASRQLIATIPVGTGPLGIAYAAELPPVSNAGVPVIGQALRDAGLLAAATAQQTVLLGSESGYSVWASPAVPGPGDHVTFTVTSQSGASVAASGSVARWTTNAWSSSADTKGVAFSEDGVAGLFFDFGAQAKPEQVQAAFRLTVKGKSLWLSHSGSNYSLAVQAAGAVTWVGDTVSTENGTPIPTVGPVFAGQALSVASQSWPEVPDTLALLHWSTNGYQAIHHNVMSVAAIAAGSTGNNTQWTSTIDADRLVAGTSLAYWVEVVDATSDVYDSRSGQNCGGSVVAAPTSTGSGN